MMVYELVGDLFLVWKDAEPLSDAEWDPRWRSCAATVATC